MPLIVLKKIESLEFVFLIKCKQTVFSHVGIAEEFEYLIVLPGTLDKGLGVVAFVSRVDLADFEENYSARDLSGRLYRRSWRRVALLFAVRTRRRD